MRTTTSRVAIPRARACVAASSITGRRTHPARRASSRHRASSACFASCRARCCARRTRHTRSPWATRAHATTAQARVVTSASTRARGRVLTRAARCAPSRRAAFGVSTAAAAPMQRASPSAPPPACATAGASVRIARSNHARHRTATLGGWVTLFVCATFADFSATSGKSHDYAGGSERVRSGPTGNRRWRTMFVASVAAGKAFCDLQGDRGGLLLRTPY